nr:lamin tail domain-containing protein [Anaeroplasmataceae bacterium]
TKTVEITPIAAPQVMIYAVYGAGGNTGASYKNDFIILYNASSEDIDLTNWTLQYAGANTATAIGKSNIATLNGVIKGYGFYTVVAAAGNSETNELPFLETADSSNSLALGASNFQLYLSTTSTQIIPASYNQSSYVDMIGAGTSAYSETAAAAAPSATTYVRRNALQDTNDNSVDFEVVNFNGTTDFDFLGQGHRAYNYAKAVLDSQNLNFNNLPDSFTLPMSFDGTAITWITENADNLSIAADGTVTVNKSTECDGTLFGTIAGYPLGFEFNVFISNKTRLDAPQVTLEHFTLTWTSVANAASYDIYIDGVLYTNTTALTYDLYDSNFASNFANIKSYSITVVAKPVDGSAEFVDSAASSAVALNFADTSNLSNLDISKVYTFAVSVTEKGVWSTYNNVNFFVVDSQTSQGFLVYRYTDSDIFNSLVYGSKIFISGKLAYSSNMPQLTSFVGLTVTGQVDPITKINSSVELTSAHAGHTIELTGAVVESVSNATNVVVKVGENSFNLYANVSYVSDLTAFGELLPGYTLNFTGAVGIYQENVQVYVTSYEITGENVSDGYKLEVSLSEAEDNLNAAYTSGTVVSNLLVAGTTYTDVVISYVVTDGSDKASISVDNTTLTFGTVEEATPIKIQITATLGATSKNSEKNITLNKAGNETNTITLSSTNTGNAVNMTAGVSSDNNAHVGDTDGLFDIASAKNKASNEVGVNKDGTLRLYYASSQNGTTLTITGKTVTITKVKITYKASVAAGCSVKINNGDAITITNAYSTNEIDITDNTFSIQNVNSASAQVYIQSIEITYQVN